MANKIWLFLMICGASSAQIVQPTINVDLGSASVDQYCVGGSATTIANAPAGTDATARFGNFICTLPAPLSIQYVVTFNFLENVSMKKGDRLFQVKINDQIIFDKLDLFVICGGYMAPCSRSVIVMPSGGQIKIEWITQTRNAITSSVSAGAQQILSANGTVVCSSSGCVSVPSSASIMFRVAPPAGPGSCQGPLGPTVGTGAMAVDENGYLYMPTPPWWNFVTKQAFPAGTGECRWIRFGPGQVDWVPDRPMNQPTTAGGVTPPNFQDIQASAKIAWDSFLYKLLTTPIDPTRLPH